MQSILTPIKEVKMNPSSPRIIKDGKFKQLVESIKSFPQMLEIRPIVVNDDMIVLGGNMRLKACQEAGLKEVHVIKASDLTPDQQREFIIKDNVGFGEWDMAMLSKERDVKNLEKWGLDLDWNVGEEKTAEEDDFEVLNEIKTDIVLGDLFEIGPHRLLCGDATKIEDVERLMNGEKADMVFTDPPYGNGNSGKYGRGQLGVRTIMSDENFDCISDFFNLRTNNKYVFFLQWRTFKEAIQTLENNELKLKTIGVWDKKNAGLNGAGGMSEQWEAIIVAGDIEYTKFGGNVFSVSREQKKRENSPHPYQKLIELLAQILEYFKSYKTLHDPFGGSGSTMIACHQLDRKCFMSELDPKYCQVIIERMVKLDPEIKITRNGKPYGED